MLRGSINKRSWICLVLSIFASCTMQFAMCAQAEQNKPITNAVPSTANKSNANKAAKSPDLMEAYKKIKSAPQDFPDLPVFNGKCTFTGGYYSPENNGISGCQMSYVAEDPPQTVLDFYKNAFVSNGWKILFAAGPTISARHSNGHICSVNVGESKLPKIKSQFTIAYRQLSKQR